MRFQGRPVVLEAGSGNEPGENERKGIGPPAQKQRKGHRPSRP